MMSEDTQSYKVSFVSDVHLIQILGEQLISSEKVGILELIKNAYDAGASEVQVWIEKVPDFPEVPLSDPEIAKLPGPVISIIDNGCGMDEGIIRNGWMRPATRVKASVKQRLKKERMEADKRGTRAEYEALVRRLKRERGGRLPLGEKGVGRFATHRLGRFLILQTKARTENNEWYLKINWDDFDASEEKPVDLSGVELDLVRRSPQRDYGPSRSGTVLRVYGGRNGYEWSEDKLIKIGHAIAHLRSPVEEKRPKGFDVTFHCPQLSQAIEVPTDFVPAPFECTAIVDEDGAADIEIRFVPPKSLSKPLPAQTWPESGDLRLRAPEEDKRYWLSAEDQTILRKPDCGPFTVDIKLWLRTSEWIDYLDWRVLTDYLDQFGGIGVFRDGLGILPAQIASRDDWLGLSTRHIRKGRRISYYMMSGSVDLVQEDTLDLVDRTSREGLLETQALSDLAVLVRVIVYALENHLQEIRDQYNRLKQGERISETTLNRRGRIASKILDVLSSDYDFQTDEMDLRKVVGDTDEPEKAVRSVVTTFDHLRREVRELKTQSDALLEAAGFGISIGVSIHEIEKITSNLYFGLERLAAMGSRLDAEVHAQTVSLRQKAKTLLSELTRVAPLRVTRLEPKVEFDIRDCILGAKGAFGLSWDQSGITFSLLSESTGFDVTGAFGACSQVFANLYDNATYWLTTAAARDRRIAVQVDAEKRKVVVADSGPGIDAHIRPHLFKPFYSLKNPPSGLGLYICRYYLRQMGGSIRESFRNERNEGFSGAQFTLEFQRED